MITPYSDCPLFDDLSMDFDELDNVSIDIDETTTTFAIKKQQSQQKRKQQQNK